jgi:hypothetical protein
MLSVENMLSANIILLSIDNIVLTAASADKIVMGF